MHSVVKSLTLFLDPESELCSTWDQERIFKLLHWWIWGGIADTHHTALHRQALSGPCIIIFSVHFFKENQPLFRPLFSSVIWQKANISLIVITENLWSSLSCSEGFLLRYKKKFNSPFPIQLCWSLSFLYHLGMREKYINSLKVFKDR